MILPPWLISPGRSQVDDAAPPPGLIVPSKPQPVRLRPKHSHTFGRHLGKLLAAEPWHVALGYASAHELLEFDVVLRFLL